MGLDQAGIVPDGAEPLLPGPDIPWPVLERLADELAADPAAWRRLGALYDGASPWPPHQEPPYPYVAVPAIVAMAAPRLAEDHRIRIARTLVDALAAAAEDDDEAPAEALTAACGALGAAALALVLDAIGRLKDWRGAWPYLWRLTAVAAACDDADLRAGVAEACCRLLMRADGGGVPVDLAASAAWTLARMRWTDAAPLLERLHQRTGAPQISDALALLEGRLALGRDPEVWEQPAGQWLPPLWEAEVRLFHQTFEDDEERSPELEQAIDLTARFSQWATDVLPEDAHAPALGVPSDLLHYARTRCNVPPERLDVPTLRQVLLKHFPREVVGDRDFFEYVIPVAQHFLRWLAAEGVLPDGAALAEAVAPWHPDLMAQATDPANWDRLKRGLMDRAGTPADGDLPIYGPLAGDGLLPGELPAEPIWDDPWAPVAPVHAEGTVGRNAPCPCGSGKKYKKCCGRASPSR